MSAFQHVLVENGPVPLFLPCPDGGFCHAQTAHFSILTILLTATINVVLETFARRTCNVGLVQKRRRTNSD
jgi:hypothetical protein